VNTDWITRTWWFKATIILAVVTIPFIEMSPEDMEMQPPEWRDPVTILIYGVVGIIVIWSWVCCGSDHEENMAPKHPDGRLTYPGDDEK